MNTLPEDIQDTIYKYKHQLEFNKVLEEMVHDICDVEYLWINIDTHRHPVFRCSVCGASPWTSCKEYCYMK